MRLLACLLVLGFTLPASARTRKPERAISAAETASPFRELTAAAPRYAVGCTKLTLVGDNTGEAEKAIRAWAKEYGNPVCSAMLPADTTVILTELVLKNTGQGVSGEFRWALDSLSYGNSVRVSAKIPNLAKAFTAAANRLANQVGR